MAKTWSWWVGAALVACATIGGATWGAYRSAKAEGEPPRFAGAMPKGALVYLEARDLSGLLGAWIKSPTRERYFASASYRSFKRSRLYLKLQDRLTALQRGFGVEVTDERLAELAGGPSAIAIYDPGKLDVLVVTEVPSQKALASTLFANQKSFESRKTAKGTPYFARDVVAEEGGSSQRIAFGYADGRLWIGTNETTVAEAIDGPQNGGLGPAIAETIKGVGDFAAHDMTIWVDMDRAVRNKYFDLYWIQRNGKELQDLASGLVDLEFAADGVHERRWFLSKHPATAPAGGGDQASSLAALRALAPNDAQLVEARSADADVAPSVAATLFGPERSVAGPRDTVSASRTDDPFGGGDSDSGSAANRYRYLDSRFDEDVDDPAAPPAVPASSVTSTKPAPAADGSSFGERVTALVAAAAPVRYATYSSVRLPEGQLFAKCDRAVVVELGAPDRFAAADFEALVGSEFVRRFVVGGDAARVQWADAGGARSLAGALVQQGGAYRVVGRYLIVANDAAACAAIAARAAVPTSPSALEAPAGTLTNVAEVRVDAARGSFVRLTTVLDANSKSALEQDVSSDGDSGDDSSDDANDNWPVLFFSENLASLLDVVRDLQSVHVATAVDGAVVRERVDYAWATAAAAPKAPTKAVGKGAD